MERDFGINPSLPAGTSNVLEQRRAEILQRKKSNDSDSDTESDAQESIGASSHNSNKEEQGPQIEGIDDEDRVIMPFSPPDGDDDDDDDDASAKNSNDESCSTTGSSQEGDDLDDLSLTPPPSLPVLLLDLEKLCGYQPSDIQEIERITKDIREALLGTSGSNISSSSSSSSNAAADEDNGQDATSLDFVSRSRELFEAGIARHCTDNVDSLDENDVPRAIVNYPEFVPLHQDGSEETSLVATKLIWKKILHPHKIETVDKLLSLLSRCSRDLIWKYQMMMEIRRLSAEEIQRKDEQFRNKQVRIWRKETRPAELAKLYDVRETFEIRLHSSREKYDAYVREREVRVQIELRRRAENGTGTGGIAGLDWDANVTFGFGEDIDEVVNKLIEERRSGVDNFAEDDHDEHDHNEHDRAHGSDVSDDADSSSIDDGSAGSEMDLPKSDFSQPALGSEEMPLPASSLTDRKKRRAAAAARRMRKTLQGDKEKNLSKELRMKIERAYAEEEAVRQMLISTDEKFALSTVMNLEKQLQKVDDLLENLQEEEWKEEEEGLLDENSSDEDSDNDDDENDPSSILDQILAMILGALPPDNKSSPAEHFSFLKKEHETIVNGWKGEFGRLPRLHNEPKRKSKAPSNREYEEAWEEEEHLEAKMLEAKMKSISIAPPPSMVSLKPDFGPATVLDDWEDGEDDLDDFFPSPPEEPASAPLVQRAGLRPGGRPR